MASSSSSSARAVPWREMVKQFTDEIMVPAVYTRLNDGPSVSRGEVDVLAVALFDAAEAFYAQDGRSREFWEHCGRGCAFDLMEVLRAVLQLAYDPRDADVATALDAVLVALRHEDVGAYPPRAVAAIGAERCKAAAARAERVHAHVRARLELAAATEGEFAYDCDDGGSVESELDDAAEIVDLETAATKVEEAAAAADEASEALRLFPRGPVRSAMDEMLLPPVGAGGDHGSAVPDPSVAPVLSGAATAAAKAAAKAATSASSAAVVQGVIDANNSAVSGGGSAGLTAKLDKLTLPKLKAWLMAHGGGCGGKTKKGDLVALIVRIMFGGGKVVIYDAEGDCFKFCALIHVNSVQFLQAA